MAAPSVSGVLVLISGASSIGSDIAITGGSPGTASNFRNFMFRNDNVTSSAAGGHMYFSFPCALTNLNDYTEFFTARRSGLTDNNFYGFIDSSNRIRGWSRVAPDDSSINYYETGNSLARVPDYEDVGFDPTAVVRWFDGISDAAPSTSYAIGIGRTVIHTPVATGGDAASPITLRLGPITADNAGSISDLIVDYLPVNVTESIVRTKTSFVLGNGGSDYIESLYEVLFTSNELLADVSINFNTAIAGSVRNAYIAGDSSNRINILNSSTGVLTFSLTCIFYKNLEFGTANVSGFFSNGSGFISGNLSSASISESSTYAYDWVPGKTLASTIFDSNDSAIRITDDVDLSAVGNGNITFSNNTYDWFVDVPSGTVTITVDDASTTDHPGGFNDAGYVAAKVNSAGATVVVAAPVIALAAPNFEDGVRAAGDHIQLFNNLASTAVDTTSNHITVGNDSNGDAPSFAASQPYTLVRFTLNSGSTVPTTSGGEIRDGGLYFATLSGSNILLYSEYADISGSPINFTAQGTGTFNLRAETPLFNTVVSGGSGLSELLSLSTGAQIRLRACRWKLNGGLAESTTFFDNRDNPLVWSASAGASTIVTVGLDNGGERESVHEEIIDATFVRSRKFGEITLEDDGSQLDTTNAGPWDFNLEGLGRVQVNSNDSDGKEPIQHAFIWYCWKRFQEGAISIASNDTFRAINFFDYTGKNLAIDNLNSSVPFLLVGGSIAIDGTDTGVAEGSNSVYLNVDVAGTGALVEATGSTLTANAVADAVWDEIASDHATSGTTGANLTNVTKDAGALARGRYIIDENTNTATLYDAAGVELVTFDLLDKDGNPAVEEVYERVPQ